jgi:uncharacterized protein
MAHWPSSAGPAAHFALAVQCAMPSGSPLIQTLGVVADDCGCRQGDRALGRIHAQAPRYDDVKRRSSCHVLRLRPFASLLIVTRLRNGDLAQIEQLAGLYALDADVSHPFHPEVANSKTKGRETLRAHFARLPQSGVVVTSSVEDFRLHTTADPEVVVAEFRYVGHIDQRTLNTQCIFVVRVVDGFIVESRDYIDHLASTRSYGMLPDVLARLSPGT